MSGQFVPVKLNVDTPSGSPIAQRYGVRGLPAIVFVTPQGGVAGRIQGYLPPDDFAKNLQQILNAEREIPALEARLRRSPGDAKAAQRLVDVYAERGQEKPALAALAKVEKADSANAANRRVPALLSVGRMYLIGSGFGAPKDAKKAIPLLRRAIPLASKPMDRNMTRMALAVAHLRTDDAKSATAQLRAVLSARDAHPEMKQRAQALLDEIRTGGGR